MDAVQTAPPQAGLLADALRNAERHAGRARRGHTRTTLTALGASTLSAVMAGLPAALNHAVVGDWRFTCFVASLLSAVAALATGVQTQFGHADRIAQATDCLGRLRALDVQRRLGAVEEGEFNRQFAEIVAKYPHLL
jgi:hypothetical protein